MQQEPVQQLQFKPGAVAFDPDKIDLTIQSHGIRFVHYQAMFNPAGLIDPNDSRRPDVEVDSEAINGMTYIKAGYFRALLNGNSKEVKAMEGGILNTARAQITTQRFYECERNSDPERVYLAPYDRLFLDNENILVVRHELATAHETGLDRLRFPVVQVKALVDSNNVQYGPSDYQVEEGCLRWIGKRPGINPNTGKGLVYSIRYLYRPFFYIDHLIHELRLGLHEDLTGKTTIPLQQCAIVNREYVYHSRQKDSEKPDQESINAPADGGFSPK
jgi:hypothetical protein